MTRSLFYRCRQCDDRLRQCAGERRDAHHLGGSASQRARLVESDAADATRPLEVNAESNATMWRETVPHAASINTAVFSMVGDVHLLPGLNLQDHLERHPGDFLPVTNLSALWLTSSSGETHSLQRPLALLNPAAILSFSLR